MMTMRERIARAICEARTWRGAWEPASEAMKTAWLRDADAALSEIEKPTESMVREFCRAMGWTDHPSNFDAITRGFGAANRAAREGK